MNVANLKIKVGDSPGERMIPSPGPLKLNYRTGILLLLLFKLDINHVIRARAR